MRTGSNVFGSMSGFVFSDSQFRIASWKGFLSTVVGIVVVNVGWSCLSAIYNLHFHPSCKIAGPKLWIDFPILKSIAQLRGQLDFKIRAFHERYGEVVRIAPDELTFTSPQAWKDIYGHGHAELAKFFPKGTGHGDGSRASDIISSNPRDHFRFRRAMLPAFSGKALEQQEPLIQIYVDLLISRLREVAEAGAATNMVKWYTFTTFDLIGDLAYGESFGGLKLGQQNAWVGSIEKMMKLFPILVLANASPLLSKVFLLVAPLQGVPLGSWEQDQELPAGALTDGTRAGGETDQQQGPGASRRFYGFYDAVPGPGARAQQRGTDSQFGHADRGGVGDHGDAPVRGHVSPPQLAGYIETMCRRGENGVQHRGGDFVSVGQRQAAVHAGMSG